MLRHGERVAMQVQVAHVLEKQCHQGIALIDGPAMTRASLGDSSLHDVAAGQSAACE